jgi:uncharacterized protein DUF4231
MDQEQYIANRVDDQQQWYGRKSSINKKYHVWSRGLIIGLSAIIPLGAGFMLDGDRGEYMKFIIALLGTIVAILSGISAMMKFHEKWITYRSTAEALLHEKYIFLTGTGRYQQQEEPFQLFVQRVESLLGDEHGNWNETMKKTG